MPVKNLQPINLSQFLLGRNGKDDPENLPEGQNVEQINIRTNRNIIESAPGERMKGSQISATLEMTGLSTWGDQLVSAHQGSAYIFTSDWYVFKTSLTAGSPVSFMEYYNDLYVSNGADTVFRAVKDQLNGNVLAAATTIVLDDASKFIEVDANEVHLNSSQTGYINGDAFTYLGVSAGTIISKVFADSPYTTTLTETTINCNATGGAITINLITAVGNTDKVYIIRKTDSSGNAVTVDGATTETIDGDLTQALAAQGSFILIRSNGTNWVSTTMTFAAATILDNVAGVLAHTDNDIITTTFNITGASKGLAMAEYGEKFWMGKVTKTAAIPSNPWRLYYSVTATAAAPTQFYDFSASGSGQEFLAEGREISALLAYRNTLIIGKKDSIRRVNDFTDASPPVPIVEDFFKADGPINEDCMVKVGDDIVYFTGKRIQRLFVPEFEGLKVDSGFDRQVLDKLENLDSDQSEASMIYNRSTGLLFLSVKTNGAPVNDLRIVYSTDTNAWWIEENMFCRKYTVLDGITYYAHSIIGRVIQDNLGFTKDGSSSTTFFEARHVEPEAGSRFDWRHLIVTGSMTTNTTITAKIYVDKNLVFTAIIDDDDIQESASVSEAIGDETIGDTMWGGGIPGEESIDPRQPFEKVIPIGRNGKMFYYTLETNGLAQRYTIENAKITVKPLSETYRLQASN